MLRGDVHPFMGITFLACKRAELPVGRTSDLSLDKLTEAFMDEHHRLDPNTEYYFQPFKSTSTWVARRYPSTGLQAQNTQTFKDVFLHPRGSRKWGFQSDYVERLAEILDVIPYGARTPVLSTAIWLSKTERWPEGITLRDVISNFVHTYGLTQQELEALFYDDGAFYPGGAEMLFDETPSSFAEILADFPPPPDAPTGIAGALEHLALFNIGPGPRMEISFGNRLSLITGDNALGKSFLLECAWWATTGHWVGRPAYPLHRDKFTSPKIEFEVSGVQNRRARFSSTFDWQSHTWKEPVDRATVSLLAVFARVDGSFAVSDPVRADFNSSSRSSIDKFSREDLWDGSPGVIEGLIRDWVRWQQSVNTADFDRFCRLLEHLSPEDLGVLRPGRTVRIPGDPRDIPTIVHDYDEVPIIFSSAGVKRVLSLVYLIIWCWREHELVCEQLGRQPLRKMLVIVDEIEAHLHPKWQRTALPALLSLAGPLGAEVTVQVVAATHSPMVLASTEPVFDSARDSLYHLTMINGCVELRALDYVKYGDASGWLTSPLFGLRHARSKEADRAIEDAKLLQLAEEADSTAVAEVSVRLKRYLSADDKFWPRWLYFAEKHGVRL